MFCAAIAVGVAVSVDGGAVWQVCDPAATMRVDVGVGAKNEMQ